jgi:hypothetical protein
MSTLLIIVILLLLFGGGGGYYAYGNYGGTGLGGSRPRPLTPIPSRSQRC